MCIHLASSAGFVGFRIEQERTEGRIDTVRFVEAVARKALHIEAEPLLEALNIFGDEASGLRLEETIKYNNLEGMLRSRRNVNGETRGCRG